MTFLVILFIVAIIAIILGVIASIFGIIVLFVKRPRYHTSMLSKPWNAFSFSDSSRNDVEKRIEIQREKEIKKLEEKRERLIGFHFLINGMEIQSWI